MSASRLKILLPFAVVALGVLGAIVLVRTTPTVETQVAPVPLPLVRVVEVARPAHPIVVRTHGTVAPRTESELIAEVSAPVVWVSPALVSGGAFDVGEPLLRLDPADYQNALEAASASLARSRSEYRRASKALERRRNLRQQAVASEAQLDEALTSAQVARARVREAKAALARAERDLARTEIRAPYAGRVRDARVDVGQFIGRGSPIATVYAIDFAEVRLPVPDEELAFLALPGLDRPSGSPGPRVTLRARFAGRDLSWQGEVVRTEGEIDARSRMVHVVARVEDPYGRDATTDPARPPLAVGLFVEAEIQGREALDSVVLPRAALRDGRRVLIVDAEDRLRYREVSILRQDADRVVIGEGLASGERVCISALQAAVDGLQVRTRNEGPLAIEPRADVATPPAGRRGS